MTAEEPTAAPGSASTAGTTRAAGAARAAQAGGTSFAGGHRAAASAGRAAAVAAITTVASIGAVTPATAVSANTAVTAVAEQQPAATTAAALRTGTTRTAGCARTACATSTAVTGRGSAGSVGICALAAAAIATARSGPSSAAGAPGTGRGIAVRGCGETAEATVAARGACTAIAAVTGPAAQSIAISGDRLATGAAVSAGLAGKAVLARPGIPADGVVAARTCDVVPVVASSGGCALPRRVDSVRAGDTDPAGPTGPAIADQQATIAAVTTHGAQAPGTAGPAVAEQPRAAALTAGLSRRAVSAAPAVAPQQAARPAVFTGLVAVKPVADEEATRADQTEKRPAAGGQRCRIEDRRPRHRRPAADAGSTRWMRKHGGNKQVRPDDAKPSTGRRRRITTTRAGTGTTRGPRPQ
jgi:hypothetical protein